MKKRVLAISIALSVVLTSVIPNAAYAYAADNFVSEDLILEEEQEIAVASEEITEEDEIESEPLSVELVPTDESENELQDESEEHCEQLEISENAPAFDLEENETLEAVNVTLEKDYYEIPQKYGIGDFHGAAISSKGNLFMWGMNHYCSIDEWGDIYSGITPFKVSTLSDLKYIEVGGDSNLALTNDGSIYGWGHDTLGQLGDGKQEDHTYLSEIHGIDSVKQLSLQNGNSITVNADGDLYVCGLGIWGQLADMNLEGPQLTPYKLSLDTKFTQVSVGEYHCAGIDERGNVYTWGHGEYPLGDAEHREKCKGSPAKQPGACPIPTKVLGISNVKYVSAGWSATAAVTYDGDVYIWGNGGAQMGTGNTTATSTPTKVEGLSDIKYVSVGRGHCIAVTNDGDVYTWGSNDNGELGNGTTVDSNIPVKIAFPDKAVYVEACNERCIAVLKNGDIYSWGNNYYGQIGLGPCDYGSTNSIKTPAKLLNIYTEKIYVENPYHTIHASAEGHGTISPSGVTRVLNGKTKKFTFSPEEGYELDTVYWDGKAISAKSIKNNKYTTPYIYEDGHTILATFREYVENVDGASVITYHLDGGENNPNNPETVNIGKSVNLQNPAKNGYTFKGWYSNSAFKGSKVKKLTGKQDTNYNLYAKWVLTKYKIKYVNPSGTKAPKKPKNPTSYTIMDSKDLYSPTRAGYIFTGWYKDKNLTDKIDKIESGNYGNLTLYSGWRGSEYTVAYEGNGATGGYTENTHHEYKTNGSIAECKYVKDGYSFVKWYKNAKCSGTAYAPGYSKNDFSNKEGDTVTLYAKWKPNKYTVVYDGNGATSGKTNNSTFTYDKKGKLAKCGYKKNGYKFEGWYYDDGVKCYLLNGGETGIFNLTTGTGTITLKAEWTPIGSDDTPVSSLSFDTARLDYYTGETCNLKNHLAITPYNASNRNITWASSDPSIANVNSSGDFSAIKPGKVIITATSKDGSNKSAQLEVAIWPGTPNSLAVQNALDTTLKDKIGQPSVVEYKGMAVTCHAFANWCWEQIFGYSQYDKYKKKKSYYGGPDDVQRDWNQFEAYVKQNARPGDILRVAADEGGWPHSIIIFSIDDENITYYESGGFEQEKYNILKTSHPYSMLQDKFSHGKNDDGSDWFNTGYFIYHINDELYNNVR